MMSNWFMNSVTFTLLINSYNRGVFRTLSNTKMECLAHWVLNTPLHNSGGSSYVTVIVWFLPSQAVKFCIIIFKPSLNKKITKTRYVKMYLHFLYSYLHKFTLHTTAFSFCSKYWRNDQPHLIELRRSARDQRIIFGQFF